MKIKETPGRIVFKIINTIILIALAFVCLVPLWHVLMASISDPTYVTQHSGLILWPLYGEGHPVTLKGYTVVLGNSSLIKGYANTIFYVGAGCILCIIFSALAAYCMSRRRTIWMKYLTIMGERGGLSALKVSIGGHYDIHAAFGLFYDHGKKRESCRTNISDLLFQIQPYINGNLIVSASGGVQPLTGIADALRKDGFDIHMDIFVFLGKFHPACLYIGKNIAQAADDLFCFRRFNYALGAEHPGVGYASGYILLIHARIEGNGSVQRVRKRVCRFVKPS